MERITEEEIASLLLEREVTGESIQQMTARLFQDKAIAAASSICKIAIHSPNERLRLQAATYVVERVLGRVQDNPPKPEDNPYELLMKEIRDELRIQAGEGIPNN